MEQTKENNYALALLAGFGLALVGGIVYGLLYYVGYVAYIGAYLIFMLASIGFKKAGKNAQLAKKDYVILALISVVVVVVAMFTTLTIAVSLEAGISFGDSFKLLIEVIKDPSVSSTVIMDLIWGVVFVIAGAITMYFVEKRKAKQQIAQPVQESTTNADIAPTDSENNNQ